MTFIATQGCREVDALNLSTDDMELDVIAHSLSQINRFAGHLNEPYSVGQHSVWVSEKIEYMGGNLNMQQMGLLHDASESFLSDMASPYKKLLPDYRAMEAMFQKVIYAAFSINMQVNLNLLHYCDTLAGLTEARDYHPYDFGKLDWVIKKEWKKAIDLQEKIVPLDWRSAKNLFLSRASKLNIIHI